VSIASPISAQKKPNIVVIFGDDNGYWNVGAYTHGMMGATPNIDSIAKDGILFADRIASQTALLDEPRSLLTRCQFELA
jgi:Sulfatase